MKIKKFRIKNYKSIVDSGDCYLTDNVTIFAGKNESGKTSILEALEDFDTFKKIREKAIPIKNPKDIPQISVTFIVEKNIFEDILTDAKLIDYIVMDDIKGDVEIELIKTFPNTYTLGNNILSEIIGDDEKKKTQTKIKSNWYKIIQFSKKFPQIGSINFDASLQDTQNELKLLLDYRNTVSTNAENIDENEKKELLKLLQETEDEYNVLLEISSFKSKFIESLSNWVPNFILFNSFDDVFPNKIPFSELEKNEWINDLNVISDLDVKTIKNADSRNKYRHKKDININLNGDYEKFWTQDLTQLMIDWDSEDLYFWIEEDGYLYEPSLRSKGKQWHLAFYIKVSARAKENVLNIILIDEPGLFLHAKAQADILSKLEDSSQEVQLIFSTHSPYLLESDKLNRIRLVHRTNNSGTKIENKIHTLADKETLTPILTAIGLGLNSGISAIDKENNVIVEGPSDFFYLCAFKRILKKEKINFIYGGGAGNMPFVGTILHGWGTKVVYLYDNDQGKKDGEKNLNKNWLTSSEAILSVLNTSGSIEDIFSKDNFKDLVIKDSSLTTDESNSQYVKRNKMDKVLLSKKFLESLENNETIKLDRDTINNINTLFATIEKKFNPKETE